MSRVSTGQIDVFISHAGLDRAWAEWAAWQLLHEGYSVELDVWDWSAGDNFIARMNHALENSNVVLALVSKAFFEPGRYTQEEWTAAIARARKEPTRFVPVLIESIALPALFLPVIHANLFGVDGPEAKQRLIEAVRGPKRPAAEPQFPGPARTPHAKEESGWVPRLPGSLPSPWNVPTRNASFVGRSLPLVELRENLRSNARVAVRALHGQGGIGKTQVAIEYSHRFAADYDLVWWINSERAELIPDQLAAIGSTLGITTPDHDMASAVQIVREYLRHNERWLLVFDNADAPEHLYALLPQGGGHVIITSRNPTWIGLAIPVTVDVFNRAESIALLRLHCPALSERDASMLANCLGDLPLALAQSAGFLAETGISSSEYLNQLNLQSAKLLDSERPVGYPHTLSAVIKLSEKRLSEVDQLALEVTRLGAFFAPETIAVELLVGIRTQSASVDDGRPSGAMWIRADSLELYHSLRSIARLGLARVDQTSIIFHRLTQAIIRDQLPAAVATATRQKVDALLAAADPGSPDDPRVWARWAKLIPHVLHANPGSSNNAGLRKLAAAVVWHLLERGEPAMGARLAEGLHNCERSGNSPGVGIK